jgi:hypothetical protein
MNITAGGAWGTAEKNKSMNMGNATFFNGFQKELIGSSSIRSKSLNKSTTGPFSH